MNLPTLVCEVMNSASTIASARPANQADKIQPMTSSVQKNARASEAAVQKLNELVKKPPFCCYLKSRKYDPL
jgi:hypothetical protein